MKRSYIEALETLEISLYGSATYKRTALFHSSLVFLWLLLATGAGIGAAGLDQSWRFGGSFMLVLMSLGMVVWAIILAHRDIYWRVNQTGLSGRSLFRTRVTTWGDVSGVTQRHNRLKSYINKLHASSGVFTGPTHECLFRVRIACEVRQG